MFESSANRLADSCLSAPLSFSRGDVDRNADGVRVSANHGLHLFGLDSVWTLFQVSRHTPGAIFSWARGGWGLGLLHCIALAVCGCLRFRPNPRPVITFSSYYPTPVTKKKHTFRQQTHTHRHEHEVITNRKDYQCSWMGGPLGSVWIENEDYQNGHIRAGTDFYGGICSTWMGGRDTNTRTGFTSNVLRTWSSALFSLYLHFFISLYSLGMGRGDL